LVLRLALGAKPANAQRQPGTERNEEGGNAGTSGNDGERRHAHTYRPIQWYVHGPAKDLRGTSREPPGNLGERPGNVSGNVSKSGSFGGAVSKKCPRGTSGNVNSAIRPGGGWQLAKGRLEEGGWMKEDGGRRMEEGRLEEGGWMMEHEGG